MNDKQMIVFGKIFKAFQMDILHNVFFPKDNIRVSLVHQVELSEMENFDSIIKYLSNTRRIISPDEFFRYYKSDSNGPINGKLLLLTFDDGLYSSYYAAKTILSKYGIKAIFFVPTKIFELKDKEQMKEFAHKNLYFEKCTIESLIEAEYITMSKDNVLELKKDGHCVLPHTHSHCRMSNIRTENMVYSELIKPKLILEELFRDKIDAFAFPIGTERVVDSFSYTRVMSIYRFCFSALGGINHLKTVPYFFHRDCIHAHYPLFHVKNINEGVFDSYYLIKMKRMKLKVGIWQ